MAASIIDLEKASAEEEIKNSLKIKEHSFLSILKLKLYEVGLTQILAHVISLAIIIPYITLLYQGETPLEVYDTITKLVIGAYIGSLVKK